MKEQQRTYIAIDLKSFYASVECVDRGRNRLFSAGQPQERRFLRENHRSTEDDR